MMTSVGLVAVLGWGVDDFAGSIEDASEKLLREVVAILERPDQPEDPRVTYLSREGLKMIEQERVRRAKRWRVWAEEQHRKHIGETQEYLDGLSDERLQQQLTDLIDEGWRRADAAADAA